MTVATLEGLLQVQDSNRVLFRGPDVSPMHHDQFAEQYQTTKEWWSRFPLNPDQGICILMPQGSSSMSVYLTHALLAPVAPFSATLPPAGLVAEMKKVNAQYLVLSDSMPIAHLLAAESAGIPTVLIHPDWEEMAGRFKLLREPQGPLTIEGSMAAVSPEQVAIKLLTSGSTGAQKLVGLTHQQILASAMQLIKILLLSPEDRNLGILIPWHVHRLVTEIAALLAEMSVYGCPAFSASMFEGWANDAKPTWFSAVPATHEIILERIAGKDLEFATRFVRSSSSKLPDRVYKALRRIFGWAVEALSMTETAHNAISNGLDEDECCPGTVGRLTALETRLVDSEGGIIDVPDVIGELCLRGLQVLQGYLDPLTRDDFTDDWFHTGDLMSRTPEGFFVHRGRRKECFKRGGETIIVTDVDAVLMEIPQVQLAVCLGEPVPVGHRDHMLENWVVVAVVIRDGMTVTDAQLLAHARSKLAKTSQPEKVIRLREDQIPRTAKGTIQRNDLARQLFAAVA